MVRAWEGQETSLARAREMFGAHWPVVLDAMSGRPWAAMMGALAGSVESLGPVADLVALAAGKLKDASRITNQGLPRGLEFEMTSGALVGVHQALGRIVKELEFVEARARAAAGTDQLGAKRHRGARPAHAVKRSRAEMLRAALDTDPTVPLSKASWAYAEIGLGLTEPCAVNKRGNEWAQAQNLWQTEFKRLRRRESKRRGVKATSQRRR